MDTHRAYELSQIDTKRKGSKNSVGVLGQIKSYRNLLTLVQSKRNLEDVLDSLKRTGLIKETTTEIEEYLGERIKYVERWLERYAPEEIKFEIKKEAPKVEFDNRQKAVIKEMIIEFNTVEWDAEKIHELFYKIQETSEMKAREIFEIVYLTILGQKYGPKMGFFLATNLERDFVIERLESYL